MKRKRATKSSADCQSAVSQIANLRGAKNAAAEINRFVSGIQTAVRELDRGENVTADKLFKQIPVWAALGGRRAGS
jgi:hypothetical protein